MCLLFEGFQVWRAIQTMLCGLKKFSTMKTCEIPPSRKFLSRASHFKHCKTKITSAALVLFAFLSSSENKKYILIMIVEIINDI